MKKMQCEVCGSTDIKKVSDEMFECQSCGVQYGKNEVNKLLVEITGEVKIDHTTEIQNFLDRGEQYETLKNFKKANEYYNKVLDFDANNVSAQDGINRIAKQQSWRDYYIIEADVDPSENIKDFLKQLATTKNIAYDIYKYIRIDSVTEKYTTLNFIKQKCEYKWDATACNKYYENQTVYKEKYDSELKKYVKEPVTEKIEKISRTPVGGNTIFDNDGFVLASNSVEKDCLTQCDLLSDLICNFEELQDSKYSDYHPISIDTKKIRQEDDIFKYGNIQLDMSIDGTLCKEKRRQILDNGDRHALTSIKNNIDADFVENYHCVRTVISESVANIFVPVQIINFTYKGEKFVAVSDLLSKTSSIPTLFPCDNELSEKKDSLNDARATIQKTSGLEIVGWILFLLGLFIGTLGFQASEEVGIFGMIIWAFSYFLLIPSFIQKSIQKKKYAKETQYFKGELYYPRKKYLSESYETFFENYNQPYSLESIQAAIPQNVINISSHIELAYSGDISDFSSLTETDIKNEDDKVINNQNKLNKTKKKRILPICLMVGGFAFMMLGIVLAASETALVFGIIVMFAGFSCLAIVGPIILGKVNKEIQLINSEIKKSNDEWINE